MSKFRIFTIDGISLLIKLFYFIFSCKWPKTNYILATFRNHSEVIIFIFNNLLLSFDGMMLVLMPLVVICHYIWVMQKSRVRIIRALAWISVSFSLHSILPCILLSRVVHQICITRLLIRRLDHTQGLRIRV